MTGHNEKNKSIIVETLVKVLIILFPVLFGLFIVWRYGVNVCYMDELRFMENKEHFLTWNYLWTQHNEHRMFFPKLVSFIIGSLFSWNSKTFMYTSQVFLLVIYLIVIHIITDNRNLTKIRWIDTFEIFCIGLCIYNAAQYENMLWGFQIAWFMIVSLGTVSYFIFDRYLETQKSIFLVLSLALL